MKRSRQNAFSTQWLKQELAKIRHEAPQPVDNQTYKYLQLIYGLRLQLGETVPNNVHVYMDSHRDRLHANTKKNYFRIIIERTCGEGLDIKFRSRYANALSHVYDKEVKPSEVIKIMQSEGGIKACDEKYRAKKKAERERKRAAGIGKKRSTSA
jgi:hypothetical protein